MPAVVNLAGFRGSSSVRKHQSMRIGALALALTLACGVNSCAHEKPPAVVATTPGAIAQETATPAPPVNAPSKIDFATQVRPIFESRCQPCHFSGGIMYERLPFDRPETITTLGTKVFSRIKDESERALIQDYLSQQAEGG